MAHSASDPPGPLVSLTLEEGWGVARLGPGRPVPLLGSACIEALTRAIQQAVAARVHALVLTGGTAGVFAAGADLRELAALDPASADAFSRRGQQLMDAVEAFPGVTLAAIRGRCIGGALDLVLSCDLRVADDTASFEHPGPRLGFITGYGGTVRLPRVARALSRSALLALAPVGAAAAARAGLVTHPSGSGDPVVFATALARRLARLAPAELRISGTRTALAIAASATRPRALLRAQAALQAAREPR